MAEAHLKPEDRILRRNILALGIQLIAGAAILLVLVGLCMGLTSAICTIMRSRPGNKKNRSAK